MQEQTQKYQLLLRFYPVGSKSLRTELFSRFMKIPKKLTKQHFSIFEKNIQKYARSYINPKKPNKKYKGFQNFDIRAHRVYKTFIDHNNFDDFIKQIETNLEMRQLRIEEHDIDRQKGKIELSNEVQSQDEGDSRNNRAMNYQTVGKKFKNQTIARFQANNIIYTEQSQVFESIQEQQELMFYSHDQNDDGVNEPNQVDIQEQQRLLYARLGINL